MLKKILEPSILFCVIGVVYLIPIQSATLPIFSGEFNNLDGSLYATRFFDLIISVILIILVSRYFIPRHFNLRSGLFFVLGLAGVFISASILEWGWDQLILRVFNLPTAVGEISDKMLANPNRENLSLSIVWGNSILLGVGIFYGLILDRNRQIRSHDKLELENLEAEVKYLRSQINPHFLFNTLNNIYAITNRNEDSEGSDAVLRLAGLMRYMLYESTGESISLKLELEHLQNYIDLMLLKYRTDAPPSVKMQIEGSPEGCLVAPLILLPFVENAFKHGIDNNGEGSININIDISQEVLLLIVQNSRFPDRTASSEHKGIGLENVKQRLKHLYSDRHELDIKSSEKEYRIDLRINL